MKKLLAKLISYLLRLLWGFAGMIVLYLLTAIILTLIPANSDAQEPDEGISIYLVSNGFHVDLVVPARHEVQDWGNYLDFNRFTGGYEPKYLAFGWGDKGFFYDTPSIEDLTLGTVVNAVFLPSPSVMHVIMYYSEPALNQNNKKIILTADQYQELVNHIKSGFQLGQDGKVQQQPGDGYGRIVDNFYTGEGSYSLFTTCNDWINTGLKKAGVKTACWAPFDKCILYHRE